MLVLIGGCAGAAEPAPTSAVGATPTTATAGEPDSETLPAPRAPEPATVIATVTGTQSGNRVYDVSGDLVVANAVDIELTGRPVWVVGVSGARDPTWVVATEDGTIEAWAVVDGRADPTSLELDSLPPGTPPLVAATEGMVRVVVPPPDASPLTHPVIVGEDLVYITTDGSLEIIGAGASSELPIDALPDGRLSVSSDGLVSVLAGPTNRYPHAVLGDDLEASRIVIIDPGTASVVADVTIDEPNVVEGIAAPWVDADGDGVEELLVTISNGEVGARLALLDRMGEFIADGPPIGRGNRWRNQLGAGPTGSNGEIEVIDVRVPHIGGVVEYFRLQGAELVRVAEQPGYTSHGIGSRNLDWAVAADVTGDGRVDVIVPTQDRSALGILSRTTDGVAVVTELELPGRLTSNLALAESSGGSIALAAGTAEGILRIWLGR
ncbi:MAG: hypothetical protein QNJ81_09380 [Acidimicrobiia bacterium]|nr:hypothetical protein [Acidimicrobiia bacterium]